MGGEGGVLVRELHQVAGAAFQGPLRRRHPRRRSQLVLVHGPVVDPRPFRTLSRLRFYKGARKGDQPHPRMGAGGAEREPVSAALWSPSIVEDELRRLVRVQDGEPAAEAQPKVCGGLASAIRDGIIPASFCLTPLSPSK